eukprot:5354642-Prymnesium_polylepis.1
MSDPVPCPCATRPSWSPRAGPHVPRSRARRPLRRARRSSPYPDIHAALSGPVTPSSSSPPSPPPARREYHRRRHRHPRHRHPRRHTASASPPSPSRRTGRPMGGGDSHP